VPRFIVSHRLSGKKTDDQRRRSRAAFEPLPHILSAFSDLIADHQPAGDTRRRTAIIDADARDVEAKHRELQHADLIIEAEARRRPALFAAAEMAGARSTDYAGVGAALDVTVTSESRAVADASVVLLLQSPRDATPRVVRATTDAGGSASIPFDPRWWTPSLATIVPHDGAWSCQVLQPVTPLSVDLPPLLRAGPLGWWHAYLGVTADNQRRGSNVRVGVADTGAGPHPFLTHVERAGAFVNGGHDTSATATDDVDVHGTHVAGIIGARPDGASREYAGIAPGADIILARVFAPGQEASASNGDVANALDELTEQHHADIINLSLGGGKSSDIEADALAAAVDRGAIVVCAAGNGNGAPVMYPAAYPDAIAVAALGLFGAVPAGSVDALAVPADWSRFAIAGLYAPTFASIGPQIACCAPGVGIISTVASGGRASYAAMSGTSMAAPCVTAALATVLSDAPAYRIMPADRTRALYAWSMLRFSLRSVGLDQQLGGLGLVTAAR
jgi:subtilisin family serine protease